MEKMGMASRKFLWAANRKAWSGIVFGLMMALPGISGAQELMTVKMTSAFSTANGSASVKTDYASLVVHSPEVGVEQSQYQNKVLGVGASTVIAEFATNGNSQIDLAGLTILKNPGGKESAGVLQALEKIGTGNESISGSFGAAGGSEIRVTETEHSTTASTKGGGVYYLVESSGVGMITAGVVSAVCVDCKPCPETVRKGEIDVVRMNPYQIGRGLDPGSQSASLHVEYTGQYKGFFEAIIARPK